jgi:hypothetical protein
MSLLREVLAKKNNFTLYEAYVTTYTFVPGLFKEEYRAAQRLHHKEILRSITKGAREKLTKSVNNGRRKRACITST